MSVGKLVVELELNDAKYRGRMAVAAKDAKNLESSLGGLNNRLKGIESGLTGTLPHLRDMAIVTSSLHSVLSTVNDTAGEFIRTIIQGNSDIEKTKTLLYGLSKSLDSDGKFADAAKDMQFLFETAKSAPFSLKEISNSFVKMRAVGIDDVESKVRSLTDSIANFGGDDQSLHRATIAIQQMASKGVVSMEELRQQLGESVPNAMNMMADGMGVTMSTLIKRISEGKVKALPAIEAMMKEMEFSMAGSSARMMETWSGMTAQLSTNWLLLQKQIGDAGFFDAAKQQLQKINEFLLSDDAMKYGQMIGDGLKSAIDAFDSLSKSVAEHKDLILGAADALLKFLVIYKGMSVLSGMYGGLRGGLASLRAEHESFSNAVKESLGRTRVITQTEVINRTVQGRDELGRLTKGSPVISAITKEVEVAEVAWKRYGSVAVSALGALTGPIGFAALSVASLAAEFVEFGNKAVESLERVAKKQTEINKNGKTRVEGDVALQTGDDIEKAKKDIEEAKKEIDNLERQRVRIATSSGFTGNIDAEIAKLKETIKTSEQAISEGTATLFNRTMEKQKAEVKKTIDSTLAMRVTQFNKEVELLNKVTEKMKSEGKAQLDIEKAKHDGMVEIQRGQVDAQIADLTELRTKAEQDMRELAASGKDKPIVEIIDSEKSLEKLRESKVNILVELSDIETQIRNTTDPQQKADLTERLKLNQAKLNETKTAISDLELKITSLKGNKEIVESDIIKYEKGQGMIFDVNAALEKLISYKNMLKDGKLIGDGAISTGDSEKETKAQREKAIQSFTQMRTKLAGLSAEFLQTQSSVYDKFAAKNGEDMSLALADALKKAQLSPKLSEKTKTIMNSASVWLKETDEDDNQKTKDEYIQRAEEMAIVVDQIQSEINARKKLNPLLDEEQKLRDDIYRASEKLNNNFDPGKGVSELTAQLRRQQEEMRSLGIDTGDIDKQLAQSQQNDALKAQLDGLKKTNEEKDRIRDQQKTHAESVENYITDVMKKADKEALDSEIALSMDSKQIYDNDATNYIASIKDQARQHGVVLDEELNNLVKYLAEKHKKTIDAEIALNIKLAQIAQDRSHRETEISALPGTRKEKDRALLEEKHRQALEDADRAGNETQIFAARKIEMDKYQDDLKRLEITHRTAFENMMNDTVDFNQVAGDAAAKFTDGMLDGIVNMAVQGKASFAEFTASVLRDISAMILKMVLLKAIQAGMQAIGGFADGGIAGAKNGTNVSSNSSFVGPMQPMKYGGIVAYADGGATKASKSMMSAGGVKNTPHIALFAEAGIPEAFIPMQDGKSIPISLLRDKDGKITAKAMLPGGRSIPATIKESNVEAFAQGGVMGSLSSGAQSIPNVMDKFVDSILDATSRIGGLSVSSGDKSASQPYYGGDKNGVMVNINIDIKDGEGDSSNGKPGGKEKAWSEMGDHVKEMILNEIVIQQRQGGLLWHK